MKIKKTYQGVIPNNKIVNTSSTSKTDTYSCDYINKLHSYSTEEQVIGKWIDGKPLYRKVLTGTTDNTDQYIISDVINVDSLVNVGGHILDGSGNKFMLANYGASEENKIRVFHSASTKKFFMQFGSNYKNRAYKIWVEYTKTTDIGEV